MAPRTRQSHVAATTDSLINGSDANTLGFQGPTQIYISPERNSVDQINPAELTQTGAHASKSENLIVRHVADDDKDVVNAPLFQAITQHW